MKLSKLKHKQYVSIMQRRIRRTIHEVAHGLGIIFAMSVMS